MQFKDYYQLLGVEPSATAEEIKKAYKRQARRYHPDVSKEKDAEQKFKEVAEAYEVLKSDDKRREYDQLRTQGARGGNGQFTPPPGWESASHYSSAADQAGRDKIQPLGRLFADEALLAAAVSAGLVGGLQSLFHHFELLGQRAAHRFFATRFSMSGSTTTSWVAAGSCCANTSSIKANS